MWDTVSPVIPCLAGFFCFFSHTACENLASVPEVFSAGASLDLKHLLRNPGFLSVVADKSRVPSLQRSMNTVQTAVVTVLVQVEDESICQLHSRKFPNHCWKPGVNYVRTTDLEFLNNSLTVWNNSLIKPHCLLLFFRVEQKRRDLCGQL